MSFVANFYGITASRPRREQQLLYNIVTPRYISDRRRFIGTGKDEDEIWRHRVCHPRCKPPLKLSKEQRDPSFKFQLRPHPLQPSLNGKKDAEKSSGVEYGGFEGQKGTRRRARATN
jgi:hypothetical protein